MADWGMVKMEQAVNHSPACFQAGTEGLLHLITDGSTE